MKRKRKCTYSTGGGLAGWAGGGTTRGTGAFFSAGAAFDFALAAKVRTNVRALTKERESIRLNPQITIKIPGKHYIYFSLSLPARSYCNEHHIAWRCRSTLQVQGIASRLQNSRDMSHTVGGGCCAIWNRKPVVCLCKMMSR
jgi:hypothetical protein